MGFYSNTSNAVRTPTCCNVTRLIDKHDRSDRLTTTSPTPTLTAFKPLRPTDAHGAPHSMLQYIDVSIHDLWDSDLAPLHPLAPIDMAAAWNATSGLVFPSVDPLATRISNKVNGVEVP